MLTETPYGMGYAFGQLEPAVPAVSLSSFLGTSSLLTAGVVWKAEKGLTLCEHYSAITDIHVLATLFFNTNPKCSPIPAAMKKITVSQSKAV